MSHSQLFAVPAGEPLTTITRVYRTVVAGTIKKGKGRIDLAIGRDMKERKKISARTAKPRASVTDYQVVQRFGKIATDVEVRPQTGRTHQIRVHLASIGHPVVGDVVYGGRQAQVLDDVVFGRPMLHAAVLGFIHPVHQHYCHHEVPLPDDMDTCMTQIRHAVVAPMAR